MKTALTLNQETVTDLQESFKLIDGTFDPSEAADVLFSVFGDKIRFHNIQILSVQERFSGDTSYSEKRLHELKESKRQVADLILRARDNNYDIEINGVINITLKEK